eukprot:TRINITY_DN28215_c0_g1_i1.p1 TRINITY_DN28215_c0_g1~~TRINITY_DN28215_c0_g1_i1.p1  ORF type:complete len:474 (+),score=44.22 TRINITY_DN28215_c0_g1_i1:61-1482(+)
MKRVVKTRAIVSSHPAKASPEEVNLLPLDHRRDVDGSRLLRRAHQMGYFEEKTVEKRTDLLYLGLQNLKNLNFEIDWRTKTTFIELLARSGDISEAVKLARTSPIETAFVSVLPGLFIEREQIGSTCFLGVYNDIKLVVMNVRLNYDRGLHDMSHATYTLVNRFITEFRLQERINPRHLWEGIYLKWFPYDLCNDLAAVSSCARLYPKIQLANSFIKTHYRGTDFQIPVIHPSYAELDIKTRFQKYIISLLQICIVQCNLKGFTNTINMWQKRHPISLKIRRMLVIMKARTGNYSDALMRYRELPQLSTVPANEIIKLCERKVTGCTTVSDAKIWIRRAEDIFNELHMAGLDIFANPWISMISLYGVTGHHKKVNRLVDRAAGTGIDLFSTKFVLAYATALGIPVSKAFELLYPRRKLSRVFRVLTDNLVEADSSPPNFKSVKHLDYYQQPLLQEELESDDDDVAFSNILSSS